MSLLLYHGTTYEIDIVRLSKCHECKDFGKGFYLTSDKPQAIRWAERMYRARVSKYPDIIGRVYSYQISNNELNHFDFHKFYSVNIPWLDYVRWNRKGLYSDIPDYDIVYGKIADASAFGKLMNSLDKDELTLEEKRNLIKGLTSDYLVDQYCFKSQKSIDFLNSCAREIVYETKGGNYGRRSWNE